MSKIDEPTPPEFPETPGTPLVAVIDHGPLTAEAIRRLTTQITDQEVVAPRKRNAELSAALARYKAVAEAAQRRLSMWLSTSSGDEAGSTVICDVYESLASLPTADTANGGE